MPYGHSKKLEGEKVRGLGRKQASDNKEVIPYPNPYPNPYPPDPDPYLDSAQRSASDIFRLSSLPAPSQSETTFRKR